MSMYRMSSPFSRQKSKYILTVPGIYINAFRSSHEARTVDFELQMDFLLILLTLLIDLRTCSGNPIFYLFLQKELFNDFLALSNPNLLHSISICLSIIFAILKQSQQFYLMQSSFNPEQTAQDIRSKSFLKSRVPMRETTGSGFFRDNKIRSCSYVKQTDNCLKAVPFYDKRNNTLYPTPSSLTQSWTANVHAKPATVYSGMGTSKPLHAYNPNGARNCLNVSDFRPPYPNSSHIAIGERSARDTKHYVTSYGNSFITKNYQCPTSHPGIQAFRNKWTRSRLAK